MKIGMKQMFRSKAKAEFFQQSFPGTHLVRTGVWFVVTNDQEWINHIIATYDQKNGKKRT